MIWIDAETAANLAGLNNMKVLTALFNNKGTKKVYE